MFFGCLMFFCMFCVFIVFLIIFSLAGWAIAGAACVQQQGFQEVAITSSIPADFEQTAATAEHIAALIFHQTAGENCLEAVVDCASVHRSFQNKGWAQGEKRPFGGLWRQCGPQQHKSTKTKAHLTKDDGDGHFKGNEAADRWAKKAALMSSPALTKARDHQRALQNHMKELKGMIHTLQAWPIEIWKKKLRKRTPRPPRKTNHDLLYAWGRRMFICRTCCKGAKTRGRLYLKPCAALGQSRATHYQRVFSLGHKLMELGPAGGFYFCNQCGCYTEGRGRGLQKICNKKAVNTAGQGQDHEYRGSTPSVKRPMGTSTGFGYQLWKRPKQGGLRSKPQKKQTPLGKGQWNC